MGKKTVIFSALVCDSSSGETRGGAGGGSGSAGTGSGCSGS